MTNDSNLPIVWIDNLPIASTGRPFTPFWDRVDRSGGPDACWPWMGCRVGNGSRYGGVSRTVNGKSIMFRAHVIACEAANGARPVGREVAHSCDNPICCNPIHLRWATPKENGEDKVKRGRTAKGDRHGRRLHPEAYVNVMGEGMYCAKLTAAQVTAIRATYTGAYGQLSSIGRAHGVTPQLIYQIVRNIAWHDPTYAPLLPVAMRGRV